LAVAVRAQTVPNTGAWAVARQRPFGHSEKLTSQEIQRALPPLPDYTPAFSLRPGTWPRIRRKSLVVLEKKNPQFVRKSTICARSTFERLSTSLQAERSAGPASPGAPMGHARKVATFGCGRPSRFDRAGIDVPQRCRKSLSKRTRVGYLGTDSMLPRLSSCSN
jgi:hypothetical protein